MDSVQGFLKQCLVNQPDSLYESVFNIVVEAGVECFEDLQFLDPEKDFVGILKPIQCRKLKAKINEAFSSQNNVSQEVAGRSILQESPMLTSPETGEQDIECYVPVVSGNWVDKIPYNKFPQTAIRKLERGERPTPAERRQIVRIVVAELLETVPAPRKSDLEPISKEIVAKYPRSFSDFIGNTVIGGGHSSLLCQLIARVENSRRASSTQLKRSLGTEDTVSSRGPEKVGVTVKYGCTHFQPSFPEGENHVSLEVKRCQLVEQFKKPLDNTNIVDSLMEITYALQRLDINKKLPIAAVEENWPFLCVRKYMLLHAEKLVSFSFPAKFEEVLKVKIPEVFSFLRSAAKFVRSVNLNVNLQHLNYIPALTAYFEEDCNIIFKIFEESKSLHEIQTEAPVTPFIACIGNPYQLDPVCTVLVEKIALEPMIPLDDALHTWFSSFYVFNLVYPEECSATLEFIQRALLSINPNVKGTKMAKRFGKRVSIHPKVLKLLNMLRDRSSPWQF